MDTTENTFFTKAEPISLAMLCDSLQLKAMAFSDNQWLEITDSAVKAQIINDVASLESGGLGSLSYYASSNLKQDLKNSTTQFCIVDTNGVDLAPTSMILLLSESPDFAFAQVCQLLYPEQTYTFLDAASISENADIAASADIGNNVHIESGAVVKAHAKIGDNSYIGPNTVIYPNVVIGSGCKIGANAVISHSIIGNNVVIGHSAVLGKEGFGFATKDGVHHKIPQLGRTIIEDDVEIGALSVVDRGALNDTVIQQGTKIGDLVDVAHNCNIGRGTFVVSQTGFAGSTTVGQYTAIGGQVGIADHLNIGSFVKIAANSGVMRDIPDNEVQAGYPAVPVKTWHKQNAIVKRLTKKPAK